MRCKPATTASIRTSQLSPQKTPAECATKEDVRAEIDRIDQALLALFAERHRYVTRMAEIKTVPHEARGPSRIGALIGGIRERSLDLDLDEDQGDLVSRTM